MCEVLARTWFVMPVYNESHAIGRVVDEWHRVVVKLSRDARLLLVNDGSTDDTSAVLNVLRPEYPQLVIVEKPNSGHGPSCLFAYRYALDHGADWVFQTDSDGQTSPDDFKKVVAVFRNETSPANIDYVMGSRRKRGDGWSRILVTLVLRRMVKAVFHIKNRDTNVPFRLIRRSALADALRCVPQDAFLANVLLAVFLEKAGYRGRFIDISFQPREAGESIVNFKSIFTIGKRQIGEFRTLKRIMEDCLPR